jgi:hypothetical protein
MFLLRVEARALPEMRGAELSGPDGGPMEIVERLNAARTRMVKEKADEA